MPYCEVCLRLAFAAPLMGWSPTADHANFEENEFSLDEAKAVAEHLGLTRSTGRPGRCSTTGRRELIRAVAPGSGSILTSANSLAHYCRPENAEAMGSAARRYGTYPIGG